MERYIVDTNILVQMVTEQQFTDDVRYMLMYSGAVIYVSAESVKEFIHLLQYDYIKPLKQYQLSPETAQAFIEDTLGYVVKYVDAGHLRQFAKLPVFENHSDPSDRVIIAQAIAEQIPVITSDQKFPRYKKYGLDVIMNR